MLNVTKRAFNNDKLAPDGSQLLPETGELTHAILMAAIHNRASAHGIKNVLPHTEDLKAINLPTIVTRTPWY